MTRAAGEAARACRHSGCGSCVNEAARRRAAIDNRRYRRTRAYSTFTVTAAAPVPIRTVTCLDAKLRCARWSLTTK